jgi:hypothetical protein
MLFGRPKCPDLSGFVMPRDFFAGLTVASGNLED